MAFLISFVQVLVLATVLFKEMTSLPVPESLSEVSGLSTRQLGDIEFSNRYAEFLRSKAKMSTICSFLRRMQSSKISWTTVEEEKVNQLMRQYMCPIANQWASDL